jgi:transcriptional regulator with XRE-family HTH domain
MTFAMSDNVWMIQNSPQYLKQWRIHRGLTQEQASEKSSLARNYLSELERGIKHYTQNALTKLAAAYSCETWELLGRDPLEDDAPVIQIWSRIHDKNKQAQALQVLETFTDKKKA